NGKSADAARTRGTRPDDVRVDRIGRRPAALPTAHGVPHRPRDDSTAATTKTPATALPQAAVARTAIRGPILLVAVQVIRNLIVDGDVIHLRDREADVIPGASAVLRDRDAGVVCHRNPAGVRRID